MIRLLPGDNIDVSPKFPSARHARTVLTSRATIHLLACRFAIWLVLPALILTGGGFDSQTSAADWPMYRANAGRTARTDDALSVPLAAAWTHRLGHPPQPAWPRSGRMRFDHASQVVSLDDQVLFGSSADGSVTALSSNSGAVLWRFFTEGPIRFAPALWQDRALVASDDGYLYALRLTDGALLWKHRGGPTHQSVLGNQRMISKWPARGGPVVCDGVVYFAAGIWPSEGIYLYALDAQTGATIWQNVDSGSIYMPQPHGGANAKSGVSAQGYLVVSGDHLFVPTGRAVPASFNRHTGEFQYFHLQKYGHNGESLAMVIGDVLFNGGMGYEVDQGQLLSKIGGGQLAASETGVVRSQGNVLAEYRWQEEEKPNRIGEPEKIKTMVPVWNADEVDECTAVVTAGRQVVMGQRNAVSIYDPASKRVVWSAPVEGVALLWRWPGKGCS